MYSLVLTENEIKNTNKSKISAYTSPLGIYTELGTNNRFITATTNSKIKYNGKVNFCFLSIISLAITVPNNAVSITIAKSPDLRLNPEILIFNAISIGANVKTKKKRK
jgi:hypothetical protein